jgi:hypothetical protein
MIHVVSSVSRRSDGRVRVGCCASGRVDTTLAVANRSAAAQISGQRNGRLVSGWFGIAEFVEATT